jgi:hypothetical protein
MKNKFHLVVFHEISSAGPVLTAPCHKSTFSAEMSNRIIAQHQSHPGIDPNSLMYDSTRPAARTFLLSLFFYVPPLSLLQHFAFIIHLSGTKLSQPEFYHQHKSTVSTDTYRKVLTAVILLVHSHVSRYHYWFQYLREG